jgi:hypothetical protein
MAFTSEIIPGNISFNIVSIPLFNVIVDEGHPLQAP